MKRKLGDRFGLVLLAAVPLLAGLAPRAGAVKYTGKEYNTLFPGLGAKGYDVVSYFTDGKPAMGSETYALLNGVFRGDPKEFIAKATRTGPKLDR